MNAFELVPDCGLNHYCNKSLDHFVHKHIVLQEQ